MNTARDPYITHRSREQVTMCSRYLRLPHLSPSIPLTFSSPPFISLYAFARVAAATLQSARLLFLPFRPLPLIMNQSTVSRAASSSSALDHINDTFANVLIIRIMADSRDGRLCIFSVSSMIQILTLFRSKYLVSITDKRRNTVQREYREQAPASYRKNCVVNG